MYEWTDVYVDTYLKERIEEVIKAQKRLAAKGQLLVSTYEQLWLPALNNLPDVTYLGQECYNTPYGSFGPLITHPFHGALTFTPKPGAGLPPALAQIKEWRPASATLDLGGRMLKIEVNDTEITFTSINVNLKPHELLRDINRELVRVNAGAYVWEIIPVQETTSAVRHLYPDGNVPTLSNAHTRADITGFALLTDRPYQHTLVYVGLAAHKTSVESLWASLIRGKGGSSMRGVSVLADGEVRMLVAPLSDFGVIHAGLVCRKALPGQWEAKDDCAYALVFEPGKDVETELRLVTLKRLQETLAFPIPDGWAKTVWEYALDAGYIQRLECGGDCRGGVRIDLGKDWQALVQNLLEQELVTV